ncbi:MAG: tetratricopeptide repeat protein [Candidatus Binatia bacterium]
MRKVNTAQRSERPELSAAERLDSWKEIAAYLKRDIRTLHRWEVEEGIPVHRHLHKKRGTVYAYKSELDAWWNNRPSRLQRTRRKMLAVLPFENLSGDPEQDYFSDGLTEEMITQLGRSHPEGLGVIARTSVMQYKGTRKDVNQIGRELGVDYVLEGSVRRAAERVRVSVQLIQVSDQTHLWAESYDRHLTDILTLQSEVAHAVTQRIGIKLTPQEQTRILRPRGIDHQAYDACLQGRFHWHKLSRYHFDTALEYFELALKRDPNYALAYEGVAAVWLIRGDNGVIPPREALPKAQAAITKAMELDDTLANVHKTLANFRFLYEWDWEGAEAAFQHAIELNPNLADVRLFYADLLISTGRADKWEGEIQRALELDPFNFFLQCFLGWHLVYLRRYEEAIAQFYETLKSEPNFPSAHMGLWGAFYQKRKYDKALKEAKTFFAAIGDNEVAEALEHGHPKTGYPEAMHRAAETLEARAQETYVPSVRIARLYAHAEEEALALDSLEKAYEQREPPLVHLNVGWDWDNLQDSPRFQDLLRGMNLPE